MSRTYVIYKIKSLDPNIDYCYIGSTQNFTKRKCYHKNRCNLINKTSDTKLYDTMKENGGWNNWEMIPIEEYLCDTPLQARMREQYWIDEIEKNKLNSIKAFVTKEQKLEQQKEYYSVNKEKYEEYRAVNKKKILEQNKEYYSANKDKIAEKNSEYRAVNKEKIAEYKAVNKEKFAEYDKKYKAINKEKIAEKNKEYRLKMKMLKKEISLNVL